MRDGGFRVEEELQDTPSQGDGDGVIEHALSHEDAVEIHALLSQAKLGTADDAEGSDCIRGANERRKRPRKTPKLMRRAVQAGGVS